MNRMFIALALSIGITSSAFAGVKVTSLNLRMDGPTGYVSVSIDGRSNELPDIKVYKNVIEMSLSQAESFEGISKNVSGAILSANTLNGKAIIKAVLPYEVNADNVNLNWKENGIEVSFPRNRNNKSAVVKEVAPVVAATVARAEMSVSPTETKPAEVKKPETTVEKKPEIKVSKNLLNEDYLNKLMNDEKTEKTVEAAAPKLEMKKDEIKVQQSSIAKPIVKKTNVTDNFSFAGYAVKFSVFLALVLGLFYGVVQLLKKGVFSRGKLGFLNNTQMIQVLSTTYVSPKRSLMIVKAHKQIFLVANSESGLEFLSEMKDTSGLIKEGEKFVTGTNFDLNFATADFAANNNEETAIKLKDNILESTPVNDEKGISKLAVAKDIVKFSDELKKKAKKLRPIEFN